MQGARGRAVGGYSRRSAGHPVSRFHQSTRSAGTSLLITTAPVLIELAEKLASAPAIAFDTETTGTDSAGRGAGGFIGRVGGEDLRGL